MANIKNYKLLDITELSASTWSTAEKVLGLDENDKVVMAQPEENVTPEYVDAEIQEAIGAETARTEEVYAKKSELPDMEDYALTSSVTQDIQTAIASETARTEDTYAKKSEVPDMDDYYTKAQVDAEITGATEGMATETWVQNQGYLTEHQDLSEYAKTTAVTQDIQTAMASETARTEDVYAKKSEVPDLNDYYTKSETDEAIEEAISGISLEGYWTSAETKNYVDSEITGATASETARTESTYAKKSEIPSLDGYWTSAQTNNAITAATEGLATEAWVTGDTETRIGTAIASETARTENDYIKKSLYSGSNQNSITKVERSVFNASYGGVEKHFDTIYTSFVTPGIGSAGGGSSVIVKKINGVSIIENPADTVDESISLPTFSDVSAAITDAIETETARTESTYAKIGDIPSLAGYWTSAETQNAITAATDGLASESYVDASVTSATQDMATKTWVGEQGYLTEHQDISGKLDVSVFTGYTGATETVLEGKADISDIPDVSDFVTSGEVATQIGTAMASETARTESTYLKEHQDISSKLDVSTFNTYTGATETVLNGKADISDIPDVSGFVTSGDVETRIDTAIATETARTESTYLKEHQSLADYSTTSEVEGMISSATENLASKQWVQNQGYLTQHQDISGKLDASTFNTYTGATETVLEGKADLSDIPDVSDFVTSGDVATQIGTAMSVETARTESTYAKKSEIPSLDGYATESYVDTADAAATATTTGWVESQGYLTEHQDISGKLDVSVFTSYTGTTETAISGKVDKTDFNAYTGATETALSGKVSESTYSTYTASTASEIAGKQETLVSGTNIKTINNQSLLGSGNIDIQGGGGGGGNVVELTQAQYDALDPPAADTTYIITDADVVDLNDYAPASGLTELSGTVETLSSTKADKANTTARNGYYFPAWNTQGIITGTYSQVYNKTQSINGSNYSVFSTNNTNHPAIFAPTSAGTAGQPLLSNGSGGPVWGGYKFAFITQTQYDALATKDATTIYFITGD